MICVKWPRGGDLYDRRSGTGRIPMEIRSILVNLDLFVSSSAIVKCAADLATRYKAELVGFAAAEPPTELMAAEGAVVTSARFQEERERIEQALGNAESTFRSLVPSGIKTTWRSLIANPTPKLIETARCSDLILVSAAAVANRNPSTRLDVGELILAAGRPVLVVADGAPRIAADKIVVAWKDTREARRAVADALPFLARASDVLVVAVDEGDYGAERPSLTDVVAWLTAHEVKVRGDILPMAGTTGATIKTAAASMGADLVVSGGYGHTRLREWLLGGVTEDLLQTQTINRLFSN